MISKNYDVLATVNGVFDTCYWFENSKLYSSTIVLYIACLLLMVGNMLRLL